MVSLTRHSTTPILALCQIVSLAVHVLLVQVLVSPIPTTMAAVDTTTSTTVFPEFSNAMPCPSDPTIRGYTTLLDLTVDLRHHASAVAPPLNRVTTERSGSSWVYVLCPHSRFSRDSSSSSSTSSSEAAAASEAPPLLTIPPRLLEYAPTIQCGREGLSTDDCQFIGGNTQVVLLDSQYSKGQEHITSTVDNSNSNNNSAITFQGISFVGSRDISIAALSSTGTQATFRDCHWRDSQGTAAIFIARGHALPSWPARPDVDFVLDDVVNDSINQWSSVLVLEPDEEGYIDSTATTTATTTTTETGNLPAGRLRTAGTESVGETDEVVDHNIFNLGQRRQRQRQRRMTRRVTTAVADEEGQETVTTTATGMSVTCHRCSFQHCGDQAQNENGDSSSSATFVLIDSHLPDARIVLDSSRIDSVQGAMVANIEQGGHLMVIQTVIEACATSIAVLRAQSGSMLEIIESVILDSNGIVGGGSGMMMATVAIVDHSELLMISSRLHGNVVEWAPLVVLQSSQVTMEGSCLSIFDAPNYEPPPTVPPTAPTNIFGSVFSSTSPAYTSSAATATAAASNGIPRSVSTAAIVVDASSTFSEAVEGEPSAATAKKNSLTRIVGTWQDIPSAPLSFLCSVVDSADGGEGEGVPAIWRLDSDAESCFGGGGGDEEGEASMSSSSTCQGSCAVLDQTQCTVETPINDIPYIFWSDHITPLNEGHHSTASTTGPMHWGTMLMLLLLGSSSLLW